MPASIISSPSVRGGVGIEIDMIPNLAIIVDAFVSMADGVGLFTDPLKKAISDVMVPSIGANFDAGGRPAWEPLSSNTQHSRIGGILVATGALASRAGQLDQWDITTDTAELGIGEDIWYGIVHQEGIDVPQREWAMFQPEDVDKMEQVFGDWMEEQVTKALWL
jgi:phage gpG-like protein